MTQGEHFPATEQAIITPSGPLPPDARHSRRAFLFRLALWMNAAVGVVLGIPIIGYLLGPALKNSADNSQWVNLGHVADFPMGETRLATFRNPITTKWDGETGNVPCWVRRVSQGTFQVFAINCAHLGCPVRWFAQSKLFLCPCHGGTYYADGSRASGPPERGLFEYEYKVAGDNLMISAWRMPTLAQQACIERRPLVQIEGSGSAKTLGPVEKLEPRCGSCQG
jgi:menaquinol-cytochrome c reductase iron-sulfur subunit